MKDDWWNYGQIHFISDQILWGLRNSALLKEGKWPPEHLISGYTNPPTGKRNPKSEGYYVKPITIIAEIESRLDLTGQDGEMAKAFYCDGLTEERIAKLARCDELDVSSRINRVIIYISGDCSKAMSCQNCLKENCKRRGRRAKTYDEFRQRYSPKYGR